MISKQIPIQIIATVGPSTLKPGILARLYQRGVHFIRLNLSHTGLQNIEPQIIEMKKSGIDMILDTEGSQIRTGFLGRDYISLVEGEKIKIYDSPIKCSQRKIYIRPMEVVSYLSVGSLISIDFDSVLLKVISSGRIGNCRYVECVNVIGGVLGSNKAVTLDVTIKLPPFSKKDLYALQVAKKYEIKHFTLSYMDHADSVLFFRELYPQAILYSKIETKAGILHFDSILNVSDGILIDRGDLSREIPFENIPLAQKIIIRKCNEVSKPVFVATHILESMSQHLKPMKSEVNDVINTALDGVKGFVLTKESAIGKYPIETVNVLQSLIRHSQELISFDSSLDQRPLIDCVGSMVWGALIEPHGGQLIDRFQRQQFTLRELSSMRKLYLDDEFMMDSEQIALGAFSPLEGFMTSEELHHVLHRMRMPNNLPWTVPILLPIDKNDACRLKSREVVALVRKQDNKTYATLWIEEIFKINKDELMSQWFGTTHNDHPGVQRISEWPDYCIAGKINLLHRLPSFFKKYELTPVQVRKIFEEKNWKIIVGFHTRNPIHRSHELIQLDAFEKVGADGLFIHPIIGKKKKGDFKSEIVIQSYEMMVKNFYPKHKVLLAGFPSYPRYAGPREAIFTAICRKNFGCSHFIVGRDHTGVGNFYPPYASQAIFSKFPDLGIQPIFFQQVAEVSGTAIREIFRNSAIPSHHLMRKEISQMIHNEIKKGERVFYET